MAGRPKKVTTVNSDTEVVANENKEKVSNSSDAVELEKLKKENEDLKSQLQMILEKLSTQEEKVKSEDNSTYSHDDVVYKEINPLKLINIKLLCIGLYSHNLALFPQSFGGNGKGGLIAFVTLLF